MPTYQFDQKSRYHDLVVQLQQELGADAIFVAVRSTASTATARRRELKDPSVIHRVVTMMRHMIRDVSDNPLAFVATIETDEKTH